jgi:hypothetical protein
MPSLSVIAAIPDTAFYLYTLSLTLLVMNRLLFSSTFYPSHSLEASMKKATGKEDERRLEVCIIRKEKWGLA